MSIPAGRRGGDEGDGDEEDDGPGPTGGPPYDGASAPAEDLMRVCFVNENIGGHGTLHRHLRIALEAHEDVTARFVDVHPARTLHRVLRHPIPGLATLDLDASGLRDHVTGSWWPGDGWAPRARTVLHLYTQSIGSALTGALRNHPSVIGTDATLLQSARLLPFRDPTRFTDRVNGVERRIERRVLDSATLLVAQSQWAPTRSSRTTARPGPGADRALRHLMGPRPDVAVADPPIITWTGRSLERKGGSRPARCGASTSSDRSRLRLITPVAVAPEPGLEVINDLTRTRPTGATGCWPSRGVRVPERHGHLRLRADRGDGDGHAGGRVPGDRAARDRPRRA